jgi:hypothetical protein
MSDRGVRTESQHQVSKSVSQHVAIAPSATPTDSKSVATPTRWKREEQKAQWRRLLGYITPRSEGKFLDAELEICRHYAEEGEWSPSDIYNFWLWNHAHKTGRMKFFSMADVTKAMESDSPRGAMPQYDQCRTKACKLCEKAKHYEKWQEHPWNFTGDAPTKPEGKSFDIDEEDDDTSFKDEYRALVNGRNKECTCHPRRALPDGSTCEICDGIVNAPVKLADIVGNKLTEEPYRRAKAQA